MAKIVKLDPSAAKQLRTVDERLMSYNVEMTEVTGGTFWKAYTPRADRRHRARSSPGQPG